MAGVGGEDAESVISDYHRSLQNFAEEQVRVLENLLRRNSECEYLRRHGLEGQSDIKSFRDLLPVIEYEAIEQDVKRIAQGDFSPILCCETVIRLHNSSGTTSGKEKLFPITRNRGLAMQQFLRLHQAFASLSPVLRAAQAGLCVNLMTAGTKKTSPGGLQVASGTTFHLTGGAFKKLAGRQSASPMEVICCTDYRQSTYCHFVCALLQASRVTMFSSFFATQVASAFHLFRELWKDMSKDIETGELSSLVTDPGAREAVTKLLAAPNPHLAALVRAECSKPSWEGIVSRLWPNARCIHCVATGSMAQYADYINFLTSSQLPIVSAVYSGSEGLYGFNPFLLSPAGDTSYVLFHNQSLYFEFMRVSKEHLLAGEASSVQNGNAVQPVGLADVEQGHQYQLIVTTGEGLWRCKVGDVLECVGFYHRAPKFRFVGRENVLLTVTFDKTEEHELCAVVNMAAQQCIPANTRLYDFTSCVSLDSLSGHYVVFWEIDTTTSKDGANTPIRLGGLALAEACFAMDAALGFAYRHERSSGLIGPLELRVVRPGTFAKLAKDAIARGGSAAQYKTPRAYKAGSSALDLLNAAVVETGRSTRIPPFP